MSTRIRNGISIAAIAAVQLVVLTGYANAFTPGDLFWAPGGCESPCGVFEITGGGSHGTGSLLAETTDSPGQIAWSDDYEALYVTEYYLNRILSIDSTGSVSTFAYGISGPTGLIRLSDGRILAASYSDKIVIDVSAGDDVSAAIPFAGGFNSPRNIVELADGTILLADQGSNRVIDITAGGDFNGAQGFAYGFSNGPFDLVVDASGRILASSFDGVFEITSGGDFSAATPFAYGINFVGLAVDGNGRTLASDFNSSDIFDISTGGDYTLAVPFAYGMPGYGDTSLDSVPSFPPAADVPSLNGTGFAVLVLILTTTGLGMTRSRARP